MVASSGGACAAVPWRVGIMVLLRHDLPDGSFHYDWLMERSTGGPLLGFRVRERIDLLGGKEFTAERIPNHRAVYLEYEGDVSGGRGRVRREATGTCAIGAESAESVEVAGAWGGSPWRASGRRVGGGTWLFRRSKGTEASGIEGSIRSG